MFVSSNDSRCTERQFLAFPLTVLSLVYYLLGMKVKNNRRS